MQVELVVLLIFVTLLILILVPRIWSARLLLLYLLLQRSGLVGETLLLAVVEEADLVQFAVKQRNKERVRVGSRRATSGPHERSAFVRFEVMVRLLNTNLLLLKLVDVFLQGLVTFGECLSESCMG